MRLPFPQDNTAFRYDGPGTPIRQPGLVPITIYADEALTTLADIADLNNVAIAGSVITIGSDGLIPDFLGPNDNSSVLWALPVDGVAYPLVVKTDAYVDYRINALIDGAPTTLDTLNLLAQAVIDLRTRVTALGG